MDLFQAQKRGFQIRLSAPRAQDKIVWRKSDARISQPLLQPNIKARFTAHAQQSKRKTMALQYFAHEH